MKYEFQQSNDKNVSENLFLLQITGETKKPDPVKFSIFSVSKVLDKYFKLR